MKKKQGLLSQMISLITYKKTKKPYVFSLGEDYQDISNQEDAQAEDAGKGQEEDQGQGQNRKQDMNQKKDQDQNKQKEKADNSTGSKGNGKNKAQNRKDNKSQDQSQSEYKKKPQNISQENDKSQEVNKNRRRPLKKPLSPAEARSERAQSDEVKSDIDSNKQLLEQKFGLPDNKDLIIREFTLVGKKRSFIAYLDGMADKQIINNYILRPLFNETGDDDSSVNRLQTALDNIIQTVHTKSFKKIDIVTAEILKGNTALYVNGLDYFITCESIGYEKRSVEAPKTEGVVKGPQEGFSENLRTNISLLRRIIRNADFITEFNEIGEKSNTTCAVIYLKGIANPGVVEEVKRRLKNINTDYLVSSGMLEQLIEDNPYAIVPTILSTERPDRAASHIAEGRVAIILDGSPFAMIVPITMHTLMHSPEDAALKWHFASGLRMIRFVALLAATMLPAFYLAITTFHQEMIPTDLLIAIAKAKENVPFPTLVEILLMEIGFELIREAGIRIPGIIGNTLGIIGALILGEAAVSANIVSPILIIIVALTGLSNFAIPNYSLAFGARITRFYFIAAGAFLGFYGIALAFIAYILMLANIKSFGVPFLSILSPKTKRSRDIFLRYPIWMQESRPDYLNTPDRSLQPKISRQWARQTDQGSGEA